MASTGPVGYFTFALHSHLPYVRRAGRWPHGEEMIHEALAETYVPLLIALHDLAEQGCNPRLTVGITPILLEQLADPDVLSSFEAYLEEEVASATDDLKRYAVDAPELSKLAEYYIGFYGGILNAFVHRFNRDVVGGFRRLREAGHLDILTSASTHPYLPLMHRDSTIAGHLRTGIESTVRHMGARPNGVWLPECAYRPAFVTDDGSTYKPGIEEFLAEAGIRYFFTETHVVSGGVAVGKSAGDVVGPYAAPQRHLIRPIEPLPADRQRTVLRPYLVQTSPVAVFARDPKTGLQVWSAEEGYPGDPVYREFHRKDPGSGLQYWQVTGPKVDLGSKKLYDPEIAELRLRQHAAHFVQLVATTLRTYRAKHDGPGLIVSAYDTELFGHWWFEGVSWLREVLRGLSEHPDVGLITANDYLDRYPPDEALSIPESSWGAGGDHSTWLNLETSWMWPLINATEERMERLVERYPNADGEMGELLAQIARELVLLQSSDWPFLVSTGQAAEYATSRFQHHLARFNRLLMVAQTGEIDDETRRFLKVCQIADNPFPTIDYRVFARREGVFPIRAI